MILSKIGKVFVLCVAIFFVVAIVYAVYPTHKETSVAKYLPINYELKIYNDTGYYRNNTSFEAMVSNNYTFPVYIYKQFTDSYRNNTISYQKLQIFLDCNTYAYLEEPHEAMYKLENKNNYYYDTYVILDAQDFNDTNFCLYGVKS